MQVLERCHHLRGIKSRPVFWQALAWPRLQCAEELASHAVLHAKVQIAFALKRVIQRHDERVVRRSKDLLLGQRPFDLFPLNHFALGQNYSMRIRASSPGE